MIKVVKLTNLSRSSHGWEWLSLPIVGLL